MSHKALKLVKKKNRVYSKYRDKGHPAVKRANKTAATELRKAKRKFEKKLAENIKLDKKSFYAYSRAKSKTKAQIGTLLTSDGSQVDDELLLNVSISILLQFSPGIICYLYVQFL